MEKNIADTLSRLDEELRRTENPTIKGNLLVSLGRIYEESLRQYDQALFHYKRALDTISGNGGVFHSQGGYDNALDGVARILFFQGRWSETEEALKLALQHSQDRLRNAHLEYQLAHLYLEHLQRPEQGIQALERVIELDPLNRSAYPMLHEIYIRKQDWIAALKNLSVWLDLTQDRATALKIMNEMGSVYFTRLGQATKAGEIFEEVLLIDAENESAFRHLEKIYAELGRWEELITLLERRAGLPDFQPPLEQVRIGLMLADLYSTRLHDFGQAERHLRNVLSIDPSQSQASEQLGKLLEAKANWAEVFQLYRADLEYVKDLQARAGRLLRLGEILETNLAKPDEALAYYESAYRELQSFQGSITPDGREVSQRLKGHLLKFWQQNHDIEKLKEYYHGILAAEPPVVEKADALHQLIELGEGEESFPFAQLLCQLCEQYLSSKNSGELNREAEATTGQFFELMAEHQRFATRELSQYFLKREMWRDLIDCYRRLIQWSDSNIDKGMYFFRIGEIENHKTAQREAAMGSYGQAIELHPQMAPAIRAKRDLLIKMGRHEEALLLYQMEIPLLENAQSRAVLCYQMGCLKEDQMKQAEAATADYEQALQYDSNHYEALTRLAVFYYQSHRWEKAAPLFVQISSRMGKSSEGHPLKKAAFWLRHAVIAENTGQMDQAEGFIQKALEVNPDFVLAFERLGDLCKKNHRWEEARRHYLEYLKRLGESESEEGKDPVAAHEAVYLSLGSIEERLGHPEEAMQYYSQVLAVNPRNQGALEAMVHYESRKENWPAVQDYYDRLLRLLEKPEDWAVIQFAKARVWSEKLGKPRNAMACYLEVLKRDPFNVTALEQLAYIYCTAGELEKGIEILKRLLEDQTLAERRIHYLSLLGRVHRFGTKKLDEAEYYAQQILALKKDHLPTLKDLVSIYEARSAWAQLAETYRKIIPIIAKSEPLLSIPIYLKLGDLYQRQLNSPEQAIEAYKNVLEIDADNIAARNVLVDLYASNENYQDEAIRQHRKLLLDDPLRVESYRSLGQIYANRKEYDAAFCCFQVLVAMGQAHEKENDFVFRCQKANAKNRLRSNLNEAMRRELIQHPGENSILTAVLRSFAEPLRELFWNERIVESTDDAMGVFARQMKEWMGEVSAVLEIISPGLRMLKGNGTHVLPYGGHSSYFIAEGGFLRGLFGMQERFKVARILDSMVGGREVIHRLDPSRLQQLFYVIMKTFFKDVQIVELSEKDLKADLKKFKKVLPSQAKTQAKELIALLVRSWDQLDFGQWIRSVLLTGNRVGLLLCGDFGASLAVLMNDEGIKENVDAAERKSKLNRLGILAQHLGRSAALNDLFRFAVSDEFFRLRKRIGQTLPPGMLIF